MLRAESGNAQVGLRRYADALFPISLGSLPRGQPVLLKIPPDRSREPWEFQLVGTAVVSVCRPDR